MDKFSQAGYGSRDIGFGERLALVMVDFQKGFTDASNPLGRVTTCRARSTIPQRCLPLARKRVFPLRPARCLGAGRMK